MQIKPFNAQIPIVDLDGKPTQDVRIFSEQVATLPLIVGTGSPEGVVEARQGRQYLNQTGGAGTTLYVKQVDDIAGDRTTGWAGI